MKRIGDSSAEFNPKRVFTQHQAVLTFIKDRVENPRLSSFRWLDLACGRGQILSNIENVLSPECCQKIEYLGIDIIQNYCTQALRVANQFFCQAKVEVCEIDKYELLLTEDDQFDVITLTNTVHEIKPQQLATVIYSIIERVKDNGFFFFYDMETLPKIELGATPWEGKEIEHVLHSILQEIGESTYLPKVGVWPHSKCNGWHILLNKEYLSVKTNCLDNKSAIIERVTLIIEEVLKEKLLRVYSALDVATTEGVDSESNEQIEIQRLLNHFFSICRTLEQPMALFGREE